MTELYKQYRPRSFKSVLGQDAAVKMLTAMVKKGEVPHTLLFTGGSGVGKTTLARILRKKIGCSDNGFREINCAEQRGIELARDISNRYETAALGGGPRVYLLDEFHMTTKEAQNAFLKMFEDTPKHVYFFLCTTDPTKLLPTIRTRCTVVPTLPINPKVLQDLLTKTAASENFTLSEEVAERIIEVANGSARQALVSLNSILHLTNEEEQLDAVVKSDAVKDAKELATALLTGAKWAVIAKLLKTVEGEPESIRHLILAFATNAMLGGGRNAARGYLMYCIFQYNFFDSKRSGLVGCCWKMVNAK